LGSAAAGKITLGGNITATSADGGSAIGIYAGQLAEIDVKKEIFATTAANNANQVAYGIWTRGTTQNSVINIADVDASIYATATGTPPANVASIKMDSTGNDVVNINAGTTGGSEWKNADGDSTAQAFTLIGVETLNVTGTSYVDLSESDSLRGRASAANGVALTDVSGELTVKDSFFNTGTGTSRLNVTGTLKIVKGTADTTKIVTFNELTSNGSDGGVTNTGEINLDNANNTLKVSSSLFAGKITGSGTLEKTGANQTLTLTNNDPFATNNKVVISGGTLALDRSSHEDSSGYTFKQDLTGSGTLDVTLNDTATKFSFANTVGAAFTGTVSLTKGTIELDSSSTDTVTVLKNATLQLASNSVVDVQQDTTIGNLTTKDGTVKFKIDGISPETVLTVGKLDVSGGVTIDLSDSTNKITNPIDTSSLTSQSLFDYAESQSQQLIAATGTVTTGTVTLKPNDTPQTREIKDTNGKVGTATFDYSGSVKNTSTQKGVYLDYFLTQIDADNGKTVTIDATHSAVTPPSLSAKLIGSGGFKFTGSSGQIVEVGNKNSDYTGTTEVTGTASANFTVNATTDNAFGKTSELKVTDTTAKVDFQTHSQTVGGLTGDGKITDGKLTVDTDITGSFTFGGELTGKDTTLTKIGNGTQTLTKENTYEGETKINAGTLALTGDGSIANSSEVFVNNNATFDVSGIDNSTSVQNLESDYVTNAKVVLGDKELKVEGGVFAGVISDGTGGKLTKTTNPSSSYIYNLTLLGVNTYTGETKIEGGTLALQDSGSIAASSGVNLLPTGTFNIANIQGTKAHIQALDGTGGTVYLNDKELEVEKSSNSFAGVITGTALSKLTKNTDNTLTLSGNNKDFEGETNINAGTLKLDGEGSIANSSKVTVDTDATFDVSAVTKDTSIKNLQSTVATAKVALNDKELAVGQGLFACTITGTGTFTKNTVGTLMLTNNDPFTDVAKINITDGTLALKPSSTTSPYTFDEELLTGTKDGTLEVTLNDTATKFSFGNNVGTAFIGTVSLTKGTIELGSSSTDTVKVLENATLKLATGSVADVNSNTTIGNLTTNNGTVNFTANDVMLTVEDLDISGNVTIKFPAVGTGADIETPSTPPPTLFDYPTIYQQQLIAATGDVTNSGIITLELPGITSQTRKIMNPDSTGTQVGTATLDYSGWLQDTGQQKGVYLDYGLTEIKAINSNIVILDATKSTSTSPSLYAKLTDDGNGGGFKFTGSANQIVEVGNKSGIYSDYTGTTEVTGTDGANFTVNATTDNAFGNTSELKVTDAKAKVDFQTHSQTVGGLTGKGEITNVQLTVDTEMTPGTPTNSIFDGTLTGNDTTLTKIGNGTQTLTNENKYEGETKINAGTLALTGKGSIAESKEVAVTGTFDVSGINSKTSIKELNGNGNGNGNGNVQLGNKELEVGQGSFAGVISGDKDGTLTKTGNGSLILSGTNTYSGATNIKEGMLKLDGKGSIANSSGINLVTGGTFDITTVTTKATINALNGSGGTVTLGTNELEVKKGSFDGTIIGTGNLTKIDSTIANDNTLTLSGTNTYSGATNIDAGTLELSGTIDKTSNIDVANNATLDVKGTKKLNNLTSAGTVIFNGNITLDQNDATTINGLNGTNTVTKTGAGTTTLGDNKVGTLVQQTGNVILAGNLDGDYEQQSTAGNFVAGTTNSTTVTTPTITGKATFNGNVKLENQLNVKKTLTLNKDSELNVDFTQFPNPNDAMIKVEGSATIDANAKATFNIKQYALGDTSKTYDLLSAKTVSGTFSPNNYTITLGGQKATSRQGSKIDLQNDTTNNTEILRLTAFTQNQVVTYSTGNQWSNSEWNGSSYFDDTKFYNGDYVIFNSNSVKQIMAVDSDVETAGMKVSGKRTFSGSQITGKPQTGYGTEKLLPNNNTGELIVTGKNTAVTFYNPINFTAISVTEQAQLELLGENSVTTGTLTVDPKTTLKLQAKTEKVTATGPVAINGNFQLDYTINPTQNTRIDGIIKTTGGTISGNFASNISDKLLSSDKIELTHNNTSLDLVHTTSNVGEFATRNGLSGNIARIGNLIDGQDYANSPLLQALYGIEKDKSGLGLDQKQFEQILFNQLGPELAADALQMNLWKPYLKIFNHLHENGSIYSNNISDDQNNIRGQNNTKTNYEFWFESYYRSENVSQDAFAGSYQSSRPGMLIGMESRLLQPFHAGVFFGYG
jgi:autotransporter-associated beta strand protein